MLHRRHHAHSRSRGLCQFKRNVHWPVPEHSCTVAAWRRYDLGLGLDSRHQAIFGLPGLGTVSPPCNRRSSAQPKQCALCQYCRAPADRGETKAYAICMHCIRKPYCCSERSVLVSGLTTHSSRRRFAARLNSGVRRHMKRKTILLFGLIASACSMPCIGAPAATCGVLPSLLVQFLSSGGWGTPGSYVGALQNLSHNGLSEAVVLLTGSTWCGTGGCTLLVLQKYGNRWHLISKTLTVRPPIRVLPERKHGWSSLSVVLAGGGVYPSYTAVLPFSGTRYPFSPSTPPVHHRNSHGVGTVIIPSYHCAH